MDEIDRRILARLQSDATESYAALGKAVGLSSGAAHERVRKLRERGIILRTTVDVDPVALGRGVLSYVLIDAKSWMGEPATGEALAEIPEVEEAHIIAGAGTLLVKIRTATTQNLQDVLRRLYTVEGVASTQSIVVLETFFERPPDPLRQ
ncbi:Lrp/AsnC family transcriptional regulator [Phytomonospora endophytica]|uniref:DNA-binding Lrp family transcriptional regulator n=1 Tax=Phytomonospora endophytica TaxID=714109 RepID=A0A841FUE2_9ACTN|nr:Lrp/AsnC family transcriptional regulator [Phytomonospora endophytica]MBB6039404.1 DNA-binding Lrp family transcriptional regulator [Phytomonospora endophytica]GIG70131.1 transcriptional regulator [Phytomonospora endophytica]